MNSGKCPKCDETLKRVDVEELAGSTLSFSNKVWRTVAYVCPAPQCRAILGVQIDPVAIVSDANNHTKAATAHLEEQLLREIRGVQNQLRSLLAKRG